MSQKFVLYKRTGRGVPMYLIKTQLHFGEILNREHESNDMYEREVLAESDDLGLLYKMKELAKGEEE